MDRRTQGQAEAGGGAAAPSADEVRRRLGLNAPVACLPDGRLRGDHELNPDLPPPTELREAAVLVPLVDHAGGLTVIFTLRTAHLAAHAGQISFPGGHIEPEDADAEAAALRETEEEIGLARTRIELVGRLDTYITRTGFRVTPVVGLVHPPFTLRPDPHEVAEAFEVPLVALLDPRLPRREGFELLGAQRFFYVFAYQHRRIWGATAGMLVNLCDRLRPDPGGPPRGAEDPWSEY